MHTQREYYMCWCIFAHIFTAIKCIFKKNSYIKRSVGSTFFKKNKNSKKVNVKYGILAQLCKVIKIYFEPLSNIYFRQYFLIISSSTDVPIIVTHNLISQHFHSIFNLYTSMFWPKHRSAIAWKSFHYLIGLVNHDSV